MNNIVDNYKFRLLSENDTKEIVHFFEENKIYEKVYSDKNFFINSLTSLDSYTNLNIRYKLYNFLEEFISIEKDNIIEGIICIELPENNSKAFNINIIISNNIPEEIIFKALEFSIEKIKAHSLIQPTKIRTSLSYDNNEFNFWKNIFEKKGFSCESIKDNYLKVDDKIYSLVIHI